MTTHRPAAASRPSCRAELERQRRDEQADDGGADYQAQDGEDIATAALWEIHVDCPRDHLYNFSSIKA